MKLLKFTKLKHLWHRLSYFWRIVKFRDFQNSLKKAIVDQQIDKVIAMNIIAKDIRKALRIDAKSNFIPDTNRNHEEIKLMVELRHGEKMKFLNIKITDDLKLI